MPDSTLPLVIGTEQLPFLGYNDNVPFKISDGQASSLQNAYVRNNKVVRRKGIAPLGTGDLSPDRDIDGLQWARITGKDYLIASYNGNVIDFFNFNVGQIFPGGTGRLTAGTDANFSWVAGNVYGGDGIKPNIRLNGVNVIQAMVDKADSSTIQLAAGGTGNLNGTYQYKVAFVNGDGVVGEPSAYTSGVTVTNQSIQLTGIPICPVGEDCTDRAIYRIGGTSAIAQFVGFVGNNTATSYLDNVPEANLGAELLVSNSRMPPVRYSCEWQSRWVGGYCTTSEGDIQTVYVSNVRQPYYCPLLPDTSDPNQGTQLPLQDPAEGAITGLHVHGTQLVVFTGGAVYTISGTQPLDFQLFRLFDHGCVAHRTIVSTHDLLLWLGPDGVYSWIGGDRVERISDQLYNTFSQISASDLAQSWAFVWDNRYYVGGPWGCVWLDLGTRFLPAAAAAFYLDTSKWPWGTNTNWSWRIGVASVYTSTFKPRIFGAQLGVGRVWELETGATDNGSPINFHWASKDLDFGMAGKTKRLEYFGTVWGASEGIVTTNLYRGSGELIQTNTFNLAANYAVTGMIRASYLGNPTLVRQLEQVTEYADDEYFRLDIQVASTAPSIELLQVDLHLTQDT